MRILIWLALLASPISAATIFSDMPATDSNGLWCVDGASVYCGVYATLAPAALFVSQGNYSITQIDLALEFEGLSLNSNRVTVSVFTDAAGAPGTLLGAWTTSVLTTSDDNLFPTTISGIGGVTLMAGASYFLQVSPVDATTDVGWSQNSAMLVGDVYDPPYGAPASYLPAFDVLGTPVPEPCSAALSGAVVVGLLLCRRVTYKNYGGHKKEHFDAVINLH
jgi:hypothetical protein